MSPVLLLLGVFLVIQGMDKTAPILYRIVIIALALITFIVANHKNLK